MIPELMYERACTIECDHWANHIIAQSPYLPLTQLDPRHFEVMTYLLLSAEAGANSFYDSVSLLATGADQGRDILLRRGAITGIVQCKRKASKIDRPALLTELLRLALFAVRDPALQPAPGTRYQLWTASGLTGRARELIDAPGFGETARAQLPALDKRARSGLASLKPLEDETAHRAELARAIEIAASLSLEHVGPEGIASKLAHFPDIRRQFFRSPDDGPASATSREIDQLVVDLRAAQLRQLRQSRRAGEQPYVERTVLAEHFTEFLADPRRIFSLVAGSGQGKTSWIAQLLDAPPDGLSVVLIPAEQIAPLERTPVETFAALLRARSLRGIPGEHLDQALWQWLDEGNRLLAIDGLDRARSEVRETLPQWLAEACDLTRAASVRLVLTSRNEAWSRLASQVARFKDLSRQDPDGARTHLQLRALQSDEAEAVYAAYGLTPDQHRGARLTTPALIALFAELRGETTNLVTRFEILARDAEQAQTELRGLGHGRMAIAQVLDWLGDQLFSSEDGWFESAPPQQLIALLDAMIEGDRLIERGGRLRLDSDDFAEFLLARRLSPETALEALHQQRDDPILIGAISLMVARLEQQGMADQAFASLLDGAPQGRSAQLDAAARAALELKHPAAILSRLHQAVALWQDANLILTISNLGAMLADIDVTPHQRFELALPLIDGEDDADWRDKYRRGDQAGRWITPFAIAVERAAREGPVELLDDLIALATSNHSLHANIGKMLLFRAGEVAAQALLPLLWARGPSAIDGLMLVLSADCLAAARFLGTVALPDVNVARFAAERLWSIAQRASEDEPVATALRVSANRLIERVDDRHSRALLLLILARVQRSFARQAELEALWDEIPGQYFWNAVRALGEAATPRVVSMLEGDRPLEEISWHLSMMPAELFEVLDPNVLIEALSRFGGRSLDHAAAAASGLEMVLYGFAAPALPQLESAALQLARSPSSEARAKLTYYAGSVVRGEAEPQEIARRARILRELIAHETGANFDQLVWKIIESAGERDDALANLEALAERFGRQTVREAMEPYHFYPAMPELAAQLAGGATAP